MGMGFDDFFVFVFCHVCFGLMSVVIIKGGEKIEHQRNRGPSGVSTSSLPWHPRSWRSYAAQQQCVYEDTAALHRVLRALSSSRGIVPYSQIVSLKQSLQTLHRTPGGWIVHGGDCAERFPKDIVGETKEKSRFLTSVARRWQSLVGGDVVLIGRICGQFAKPRSRMWQETSGGKIPNYRGELIHSIEATASGRRPDPYRLWEAYEISRQMLAQLGGASQDGSSQLCSAPHRGYNTGQDRADDGSLPLHTSHEGLILLYEESLTRSVPLCMDLGVATRERDRVREAVDQRYYNAGAHLLWIGERTREVLGAHVEYFRGLDNPIAVKLGPAVTPDQVRRYAQILNPHREWGKLIFITRLGVDQVSTVLPPLIKEISNTSIPVMWSCDPMHGNDSLCSVSDDGENLIEGGKKEGGGKTRLMSLMIAEFQKPCTLTRVWAAACMAGILR